LTKNILETNTNTPQELTLSSLSSPLKADTYYYSKKNVIESSIDFILSHFEEPLFPRKISTYKSQQQENMPFQFKVGSKKEIIDSFIESNFLDCSIGAYPSLIEYKGVPRYKPNFIFIDLDRKDFKDDKSFERAIKITLRNIKDKLNGFPTILQTGGGIHFYQPIYIKYSLENFPEFDNYDKPSEQFLRFAKEYLTNGKADNRNNPSFRSCLIRVPGSIRSKYNNRPVKIIQEWNGDRVPITKEIIEEFRTWLIQKKIDQQKQRQKISNERSKSKIKFTANYYNWIEQLLQTPIEDYRKLVLDLVLAPYLINLRQLSFDESYNIISSWLNKCNEFIPLDNYRNFEYRIRYELNKAINKGIGPMSIEKIKTDKKYSDLNEILRNKGILN
jgi:hypothetical protein